MEPKKTTNADNCYPCKEWEAYGDGTGKWVHYPEGTEPINVMAMKPIMPVKNATTREKYEIKRMAPTVQQAPSTRDAARMAYVQQDALLLIGRIYKRVPS